MKINRINYSNGVGIFSTNVEKKKNTKLTTTGTNSITELPNTRHYYNLTRANTAISFLGRNVYIVDGGNHATNMEHFAHAISKDMDTEIFEVSTVPDNPNMKSLKALEQQLKSLRNYRSVKNEYIAIPALASVPILNLQDQYNAVMKEDKKFTPENLKANKENILEFLRRIYEAPNSLRKYVNYMDKNHQGLEYAYGVIREINNLVKAGANVYIPSGHPQDETLKWMAEQRGLKPELYNFIATGKDKDGLIFGLHEEIKDKNWYDFNLLSLSEANVVGLKGAKGPSDYMFAAYDSCVTDGARGVYNFTPIRKNNEIVGYSYTDEKTIEYPFDEFPANKEVANIAKFVGLKVSDVLATQDETRALKESIKNGYASYGCADKLYRVNDIFTPSQIAEKKMNLQGEFVDKSLKLFFSKNQNGDVIFKKCDCEGSGKPSVLSMWGSCFAVFNAIARDIQFEKGAETGAGFNSVYHLVENARRHLYYYDDYNSAENFLNRAIIKDKALALTRTNAIISYTPYMELGYIHFKRGEYDLAAGCYNNALKYLSKELVHHSNMSLGEIQNLLITYNHIEKQSLDYDLKLKKYNKLSLFQRIFNESAPEKPKRYGEHCQIEDKNGHIFKKIKDAANIYRQLADICTHKGESYPARVCEAAAKDIKKFTNRGIEVILARANGVQYIGDLYNEIKPN